MPDQPRRSTLNADYQRDWPEYFDAVTGQPPRDTLLRALAGFGSKAGRALDIACGEGRDTRAMLERGWSVIAVDSHADAVARTIAALAPEWKPRCAARQLAMETIPTDVALARARTSGGGLDLVNASFALPFCDPGFFPGLWAWIGDSLHPGGRFCGQFFGDRDEWQPVRPASHVTRAQLVELLGAYDVEHLDEVEKDGGDAMGGVKHHHVFHVVARKR